MNDIEDQSEEQGMSETDNQDDDWAAAMNEQAASESGDPPGTDDVVSEAPMDDLQAEPEGEPGESVDLDGILDIPVTLSVEIGSTGLSIRNLLQLNQGSVVELDRLAGEPLDVLVNGTLVAHGEVVVVNEKFGIRLTDVVTTQERVRKLA
jgi:flagellar motor switch protein FliN/FliY